MIKSFKSIAVAALLLGLPLLAGAALAAGPSGLDAVIKSTQNSGDDFLNPDMAFQVTATPDGPDRVKIVWQIADGYYLYRARMKASITSDHAQSGALALPTGQSKTDEYFGKQEIYHHEVSATLPVARAPGGSLDLPVSVTYQGCAEAGLCYSPITKTLNVNLPGSGTGSAAGAAGSAAAPGIVGTAAGSVSAAGTANAKAAGGSANAAFVSEQDSYASVIRDSNIAWVVISFLVAGIGLSFTPCVLPMVPIVSGIIVGDGTKAVTTKRSFLLSLTYVLGMATTYTAAGIAVAAGGQQVQAAFQQPWILMLFAALFVVLAISMFGLFTLQMPAAIQTRLATVSNRQSAGTYGGVAVMGALSALIVTTCVAPALVGALLVIGQSGNLVRGGVALFAMGLGMGTPLLIVGASAGKLLPKAGPWMDLVKKLFGALMLAVAAWMLSRIVPERFALLLWSVPLAAAAVVLWTGIPTIKRNRMIVQIAAAATTAYAAILLGGGIMGNTDPLSPLTRTGTSNGHELTFHPIKSVADLQREVVAANAQGKAVLLDFYADWCVSCKEMERYTFTDANVQSALGGTVLLRANVTDNDAQDQALLQHFGIFGPPTIAFYGADGQERRNFRVVGYMKAAEFASVAHAATGAAPTT